MSRTLSIFVLMSGLASSSFSATITQTYSGSFPANFAGTLPNQDTALLQMFTLSAASNLTATTTSYAAGGFQSNLLLFNSTGNFVAAGVPFGVADPTTGLVGDMRLTAMNLPAGMYTLAVTDFLLNQSLTATNLSDGFTQNFGNGVDFLDANGNTRTGAFAFTITADSAAAIPEPGTLWLAAPTIAVLAMRIRRQRKNG